jgi:hypothetical protein
MPSPSDFRDRLTLSVKTHGETTQKIVVGVLLTGLVVGSYFAGQNHANHWWRTEIESRSAGASAVARECQSSCVNGDQRRLEAFARDHAKPAADAELAVANARAKWEGEEKLRSKTGAPPPRCTIAAECLRD